MASCVSRLGAHARFIGKVGKDAFGEGFISLLEREKVAAEGVLYSDHLPTAVGLIICGPGGSNIIVIDIAANAEFSPGDVLTHRDIVESSDVVVSPLEIPIETALTAAKLAKAQGKRSILNPAPATDLRGLDLSAVYALTPNDTEARVCLGLSPTARSSPEDLGRALLELGVQNVVITLGERGAMWISQHGVRLVPALEVSVVDTVGAGDAFNAGLAVGLSENLPIEEAIVLGVTAASLSTQKRETIESYPYRDEVELTIREACQRSPSV
jgi:ribokinase